MKKRTQAIIFTVLLLVFCLGIFAACSRNGRVNYFEYGKDSLGVMGKLVFWMHQWIGKGNYGWTVVLFTVFLKLIMTPLDIWQRVSSKKSTIKMQKMQPLLQEIEKRYGQNTPRANEEKQKLYKKEGFSSLSMCLPMVVTMVVFFVMFAGLRDYSTYCSVTNFQQLSDTYFESYYQAVQAEGGEKWEFLDAQYKDVFENSTEENPYAKEINSRITGINRLVNKYQADCDVYRERALKAVANVYEENHESWLWIQNVWQPDTWATVMPAYSDKNNGFSSSVNMKGFGSDEGKAHYELIRSAVLSTGSRGDAGKWNGLMLLPIFSIGLSFLSIFITQKMDSKTRKGEPTQDKQQAATNKTMMIIMPLMMAFFGFMYTGAFAIYMVANYLLSILSTVALYYPVEKWVQKSLAKQEAKEGGKASYMR